jgi:hypothetical protein
VSVNVDGLSVNFCPGSMPASDQVAVENSDVTREEHLANAKCTFLTRPVVSAVNVLVAQQRNVVVTLGDSTNRECRHLRQSPAGNDADVRRAGPVEVRSRCAHQHGIKVIGGTILPFEAAMYYSPQKEAIRSTVNQWIRTAKKFDGVVDFDAAVRDPASPGKLKAEYDMGDHLHPNADGHRQMAEAVDLSFFK